MNLCRFHPGVLAGIVIFILFALVIGKASGEYQSGELKNAPILPRSAETTARWDVPEWRLPMGATSWWDHRGLILGILAVCLAQSATIAGLLLNRVRRRRLEGSLREREQQIELASRSADLGLWVRDLVTGRVYATEKFRNLLGFTADEPLTYEKVLTHLHPEDRESMRQAVQHAVVAQTFYDTNYRAVRPDGTERWIHSMGQAEYNKSGKAIRTLDVSTDITQHRNSQSELRELRQELAHVDRVTMLGQLSATLAHELSQPLGAILRNAEAAELFLKTDQPDLEEVISILGDIRADDKRAGDVIERMREMLKRRNLESQPLDLPALTRNVTALVRGDAAGRHIVIDTDIPDNLPSTRGDRIQIQQVLLNLILNAMDAVTTQTEHERSVVVRATSNGAGVIEIAVSDTGHGIPADKIEKLFEPFFTTKEHGMGIGLAISRTIVGAHGGRIWAKNNAGRGATFVLTLPITAAEATA